MRAPQEVALVRRLAAEGLIKSEIARAFERRAASCPVCSGQIDRLPRHDYVYLLGLYLGDGTVSEGRRDVYKLRIACADAYPQLMQECEDAMAAVLPHKVGRVQRIGCTERGVFELQALAVPVPAARARHEAHPEDRAGRLAAGTRGQGSASAHPRPDPL